MKNHAELADHNKFMVLLKKIVVIIFHADIIIGSSFIVGNTKNYVDNLASGFLSFVIRICT